MISNQTTELNQDDWFDLIDKTDERLQMEKRIYPLFIPRIDIDYLRYGPYKYIIAESKFACPKCFQKFSDPYLLREHRTRLHPVSFKCILYGCRYIGRSANALECHLTFVHFVNRRVCPFRECYTLLTSQKDLNAHLQLSHKGELMVCCYPDCSAIVDPLLFESHLHHHKLNFTETKCPFSTCSGLPHFKSPANLWLHLKRYHRYDGIEPIFPSQLTDAFILQKKTSLYDEINALKEDNSTLDDFIST